MRTQDLIDAYETFRCAYAAEQFGQIAQVPVHEQMQLRSATIESHDALINVKDDFAVAEQLESETLDDAYYDRNQAVQLAAIIALRTGFCRVGVRDSHDPDWPILYMDLPNGQVSWHLPLKEVIGLGSDQAMWPPYPDTWDGHTLEEKRRIIQEFICG
jgi:hypothetical protein